MSIRMGPPCTVGCAPGRRTRRRCARMSAARLASQERTDWQRTRARSRRPPLPSRQVLSASRSGEQRRQQFDRLCFLRSSERLDPDRAKPDLTVIDCRCSKRHHVGVAAGRVVVSHRFVDAPAEEPNDQRRTGPGGYARRVLSSLPTREAHRRPRKSHPRGSRAEADALTVAPRLQLVKRRGV